MMFFILMLSAYVAMASKPAEDCPTNADILQLKDVCKSSTNVNGADCAPFETRRSQGCFETRFYPRRFWVDIKLPWGRKENSILDYVKTLDGYRNGHNDMDLHLNFTYPIAYNFKFTRKERIKFVLYNYYIPVAYQDDPPEPYHPKAMVYISAAFVAYIKPYSISIDVDFKIEELNSKFDELIKELRKAHVYDFEWKRRIFFVYCTPDRKKCRLEVVLLQNRMVPPAPLDVVCNPDTTPHALECHKGESMTVDGSNGQVEERKYTKVYVVYTYVVKERFKFALKRIQNYVDGENEASAKMTKLLPNVTFHGTVGGAAIQGVAAVLKDGQSAPKPTNNKVKMFHHEAVKLYVLAFGGEVKNYKETYTMYYHRLCMMLDDAHKSYIKDLYVTLEYSGRKGGHQRHEVAVLAMDS